MVIYADHSNRDPIGVLCLKCMRAPVCDFYMIKC